LYHNLRPGSRGSGVFESQDSFGDERYDLLELAIKIDETVKHIRSDGWRGVQAREQVIKGALYDFLRDEAEVERVFLIIKQQREY
jgi:type I restriction enzyme R subunit